MESKQSIVEHAIGWQDSRQGQCPTTRSPRADFAIQEIMNCEDPCRPEDSGYVKQKTCPKQLSRVVEQSSKPLRTTRDRVRGPDFSDSLGDQTHHAPECVLRTPNDRSPDNTPMSAQTFGRSSFRGQHRISGVRGGLQGMTLQQIVDGLMASASKESHPVAKGHLHENGGSIDIRNLSTWTAAGGLR